ncbi:hypothetical protein [Pedococcus sp. 5OH_020]|uniref:hypothetical protein n=1 Tax=Pedococcus sp. 5OH_020 TaxID=2989814 RepID=UPI0022EA06BB|nr:hypothetical protein [Pedococcus sp. 5OH_020]
MTTTSKHTGAAPGRSLRVARAVALALATAGTAILVPAGTASARSPHWQHYEYPDHIEVMCGSTPVHLTWPVNKEYFRDLAPAADGSYVEQVTGSLTALFTTDSGGSLRLNLGGPGETTYWPNGDYEVHSEGHYGFGVSPAQAAELGVPEQFSSFGLIDFVYHKADDSMTPVTIPGNVTDTCAQLGIH